MMVRGEERGKLNVYRFRRHDKSLFIKNTKLDFSLNITLYNVNNCSKLNPPSGDNDSPTLFYNLLIEE